MESILVHHDENLHLGPGLVESVIRHSRADGNLWAAALDNELALWLAPQSVKDKRAVCSPV